MSKIYTIQIEDHNYSKIKLCHSFGDRELTLSDISFKTRKFFHGDMCTFNEKNKEISVIDSKIFNHKLIVGEILIDNIMIYCINKQGNPYYVFTPISPNFPKSFVAINQKIKNPEHRSRYNVVIKYVEWTQTLPRGELVHILGKVGEEEGEYCKILYEYGILPDIPKITQQLFIDQHFNFNTTIYDILHGISQNSSQNLAQNYTKIPTKVITIDPCNCLDVDDGISYDAIIKNDRIRRDILKDFEHWVQKLFIICDKADSDVAGSKGNRERFYLLKSV